MPSPTTISRNPSDRGNITAVRTGDQTIAAISAPDSPLDTALAGLADHHSDAAKRLLPAALIDDVRGYARSNVFPALALERDDAAREAEAISKAEIRMREPLPSVRRDWFLADVERLRAMSPADRAQHVAGASLDELAAYADAGQARTDMNAATWQMADHRFIALTFAERVGLQADYRIQPTPEKPFATGPDREAVELAAAEVLARHEARKDAVIDRETHFRSVLAMLAAVLEMSPNAVLDEVLSA